MFKQLMKSMVCDESDLVQISNVQVMESAAGWYLGRTYYDDEMQGWYPWSRETEYMHKTEAERLLATWEQ